MEQDKIIIIDENNVIEEIAFPKETLKPPSRRKKIFTWIINSFLVIGAILLINYKQASEFIHSLNEKAGIKEYNQGMVYMTDKKTDLAEELFQQAIDKNRDLAEAHFMLGSLYLGKDLLVQAESRFSECIFILNTQMALSDESFSKEMLSSALYKMYKVHYKKAEKEKAKQRPAVSKHYLEMAEKYLNATLYYDHGNQEAKEALWEITFLLKQ